MKFILVFSFLVFWVSSCNLVQMFSKHTQKSLERRTILNADFSEDSLHINYWKGGKGPTIVFIHGFGGDAMVTWGKELKHFAETHTVIAYDLLWFGKSYSNEVPNLTTQTAALKRLLAFLKVESATFVGQSYGGFVVLDFANKNPQMVEKMVISNSPGPTFNLAYLDTVCKNFQLNSIADLFVLEDPKNVQRLMDATTYTDPHVPKFLRKEMFNAYFTEYHPQLRMLMQSLVLEPTNMDDVSKFRNIPTLVLWGEKDEIFPKKEGEKFAEAIQAKFISLPKCGHAPQIDAPKTFLRVLNDFISPLTP